MRDNIFNTIKNKLPSRTKRKIPVTVITGYLGSGKTTVIMNILKQLKHPEKVVWLKNEYGDLNIDGLIAKETNVKVAEVLNGCLCCVLVGRLGNALEEIMEKYAPERIIIETSGTAYPAPIVWELSKLADRLRLDGVINVIDARNFTGYDEKGYNAKLQTKFIDLIIINKYPQFEPGSEQELDLEHRLDDVYELNPSTPKIKTETGFVDADLLLGIDSETLSQLSLKDSEEVTHAHADEVETLEFEADESRKFTQMELEEKFKDLEKHNFIRIKGVFNLKSGPHVYNWVFGKGDWIPLQKYAGVTKYVAMGKNISGFAPQLEL